MANDIKTSQPVSGDQMGITFSEIHSDEPHEAVTASKTAVKQPHTSAQSHLSDKNDVFNVTRAFENGHIEAGTIVSDKKDSRPSFGHNIVSAFSEWWDTTKNAIDNSATKMHAPLMKKAGPVVSKVETRVEVVKTAATHANMAPKDDHNMIVQRIRTFKQDVARAQNSSIVVKEQREKKSSWTHTEEKPAEPARKIEPEKIIASVATPQKMIPTPPHKETGWTSSPVPQTPIPPVPHANIPKPPHRVPAPEKSVTPVHTIVTELKRTEAPVQSTPRMNVPDTVVKKDISLPKKNIWVAPRIQPESSVLVPHNTPAPVSQSFLANQNPPVPPVSVAAVIHAPIPSPSPVVVPKIETVLPIHSTPLIASVKPLEQGLVKPFHSVVEGTQAGAQKMEALKPAPVPVPVVPQPTISIRAAHTTPPVTVTTHNPIGHDRTVITALKEISKATPTPVQPKSVIPSAIPHSVTPPSSPLNTFVDPELNVTTPHILRPSLYKKTVAETSQSLPLREHVQTIFRTPAPFIHDTPAPRLQEIPKQTEVEMGGYAHEKEATQPKPIAFRTKEETPRTTFVPLPRPAPQAPPQSVIEIRSVHEEKEEVSDAFENATEQFVPRAPAPLPSRPIAMPSLERVILSPVQEQTTVPAPSNKAFRTFVKWGILVLIILAGIALALFASIYFNVFKKETTPAETPTPVPTFIKTSVQTPLMLEGTKEALLTALKENVAKAGTGLTQFYPTMREGEATRPGSSAEILDFLNTHIDARTQKSLSPTIMIGSIATSKNEPFVILQSSNFDVLFTGLLAWEPYLYSDFAPLFGEQAPSKIKFKDAVRDNTSTRILYDDAGNEVLLYSFINQKTVVITTSGEALSELIKQF